MDRLTEEAERYVRERFIQYYDETFVFHNYNHTAEVVSRALEIGAHEHLGEEALRIIRIAAMFHDIGYLFTTPDRHEAESVQIMSAYFSGKGLSPVIISEAAACIMATKIPTNPSNILQQVLCDADTYHFGTADFAESDKKVYLEFKLRNNGPDRDAFLYGSVALLQSHVFYTNYCKALLNEGKAQNLSRLIRLL